VVAVVVLMDNQDQLLVLAVLVAVVMVAYNQMVLQVQ